jgi:beta-lactamase class A
MTHKPHYSLLWLMLLLSCSAPAQSNEPLRAEINKIVQSKKADIGVSVMALEDGDTLSVNGNKQYTMMSVVKFPQALFVLYLVDHGKANTSQMIHFGKEDFGPETWSPLKTDKKGQPCDITLKEALTYAVGSSDNIVCDKLYKVFGGPKEVTGYIHSIGVKNFVIGSNYTDMMKNGIQSNNVSPEASTLLLQKFLKGKILSDSSRALLWTIMSTTKHAPDRIKALLPADAVVAHKTGTYFTDKTPLEAINDIGIVRLPNGKHYAIAIYVNNSYETPEVTTQTMAQISKVVWDYFNRKH